MERLEARILEVGDGVVPVGTMPSVFLTRHDAAVEVRG